jgi:hypothetical protein
MNQKNQMNKRDKHRFVRSTILALAAFSHWRQHDDRDAGGKSSEPASGAHCRGPGGLGNGIVGLGFPCPMGTAGTESLRLLVGTATVSPADGGDPLVICRCDQGKPSRSRSRCRTSNGTRYLRRWCDGREGKSLRWSIWRWSRASTVGFNNWPAFVKAHGV